MVLIALIPVLHRPGGVVTPETPAGMGYRTDIDAAKIVWARDIQGTQSKPLHDYF